MNFCLIMIISVTLTHIIPFAFHNNFFFLNKIYLLAFLNIIILFHCGTEQPTEWCAAR